MANAKKSAAPAKEKKEKKERGPKEHQLTLATTGNESIQQTCMHVRGFGVHVITTLLNAKGEAIGVSTDWIPGLKPKSKKGERFLVIDKGPKPKKDKKEKAAKK